LTGWIGAIAEGTEANWEICKQHALWGTPSGTGARVRRGDALFLWKSGEGWLAHCRATTDARAPRDITEVPWLDPQRYRYLFGIEVLREPPVPIAMSGAEATRRAGLQATIRLGQFPAIDDRAVAELARLFGPISSIEAALTELLRAAGIEVPPSVDERDYAQRLIAVRRGQQSFRQGLLRAFDGRCCLSGSRVEATLEAAHIRPYRGTASHAPGNGLLLRTDLHTLFDLHLVTVMPYGTVRIAPDLRGSEYEEFDERQIRRPIDAVHAPNRAALAEHNAACTWLTSA
jgi:putative restriction endonuclease